MNRIWKWLNTNPKSIYIQFGLALMALVGGIYGCNEDYFAQKWEEESNQMWMSSMSAFKFSDYTPVEHYYPSNTMPVIQLPYIDRVRSLNLAPGSPAERKLSWSGNQPESLRYYPPPGATNLVFSDPTKQPQAGGPPYIFSNSPQDIPVQFNLPALPAGKTSWTVTETLQSTNSTGTKSVTLETTLGSTAGGEKALIPRAGALSVSRNPLLGAPLKAIAMQRWFWADNVTMNTGLCQQMVDWFQSSSAFVALRTPVTFPTADPNYYQDPVLLVPGNQARMELLTKSSPPQKLLEPMPLELRPERISFAQNRLPAATGERWVTVGVAQSPKAVCPADLNQTAWEFFLNLPLDLFGNTGDVPLYFCHEGQHLLPVGGQLVQKIWGRNSLGAIQADGITCIGPQTHSLASTFTIKLGNPGIAWGIKTPKEVKLFHELYASSYPVTLNFSIDSQITGANWKLYEGTETAPDLNRPIGGSVIFSNWLNFIWLVGNVPDGTAAGSYNVAISAMKDGEPTVKSSITDLVWVGIWAPPPLPGGISYSYLPLILQKQ
jgi:hypothetical protein